MNRSLAASSLLFIAAIASELVAQPAASPRDTTRGTVGVAKVLIDYGRPSKRGRMIFDSLVPYGEVWRTGANAATTLVTDQPIRIGTLSVPAGTYTLFTVPGKDKWTLVVSKKTGQWGTAYDPAADLGRTEMKAGVLPAVVEKFAIKLEAGTLRFEWDKTVASVTVSDR